MIISPSNYHGNKDKWDIYFVKQDLVYRSKLIGYLFSVGQEQRKQVFQHEKYNLENSLHLLAECMSKKERLLEPFNPEQKTGTDLR